MHIITFFIILTAPFMASAMDYDGSFNRFSPTERASSHGVGVNLGSGLEQIYVENAEEIEIYTVTRAWLTKGVFWPLDIGFGAASIEDKKSYSGYIQYTTYESFMTPALAFRSSHSRMFSPFDGTMQTTTAQTLVSWGYRTLSFWGTIGYAYHAQQYGEDERASWGEFTQDAGIYWHVLPPFISISTEMKTAQTSPKSYSIKLAVGI